MPTNDLVQALPESSQLDTGINNIPAQSPIPQPELTVNQNFSTNTFFDNLNANLVKSNSWLKSADYQTPLNTRLKDTLRYDSPTYGYDANDPNIETEYGDRQGFLQKWGHNLIKTGANILGSFAETLGTIPLVIDSAISGNLDKMENNSLTNAVSDWTEGLETEFPNYQTTFEKNHPILNYVPFLGNSGDSWGGVLKNLGFVAGTIAGAAVEDTVVGAITGGVGDVPLVGTQMTTVLGRLGKVFGAGTESVQSFQKLLQGGKSIEEALATMSSTARIIDKTRYGLSLFTSAAAQGQMQGNMVSNAIGQELKQRFFNQHGYDATGDDAEAIDKQRAEGAKAAFMLNTGTMMLTEGIQFGSLLKPASLARQGIIESIDEGIGIKLNKATDIWEAIAPATGFKGILSRAASAGTLKSALVGAAQGGEMSLISSAAQKYEDAKFDNSAIDGVDNFISSTSQGLNHLFTSREGLDNLIAGGLLGAVIHPLTNLVERATGSYVSPKERTQQVIDILNTQGGTTGGLFTDQFNSAVRAYSLQNKMESSMKEGDLYEYHNNKFTQLFGFVDAGIKTHRFEAQMARLEGIKDLPINEQRALLKIDDPNVTKQQLDAHVDALMAKALDIKSDITKINDAFKNPFNARKDAPNFHAFEDLKSEMAINLSEMKDNRSRMQSMQKEIGKMIPNANIDQVVNLTNEDGIKQTVKDFSSKIADLKRDEELLKGEDKQKATTERKFLEDKSEELNLNLEQSKDPTNPNFNHLNTVNDLLNYYNNSDLKARKDINFQDTIEAFNKAQDIYKLGKGIDIARDNFNRFFKDKNELKKGFQEKLAREDALRQHLATIFENQDNTDATPYKDTPDNEELDEHGNVVDNTKSTPEEDIPETEDTGKPFDPEEADAKMAAEKAKKTTPPAADSKEAIQAKIDALSGEATKERQAVYDQQIALNETPEKANAFADRHMEKTSPVGKKIKALQKKLLEGTVDPKVEEQVKTIPGVKDKDAKRILSLPIEDVIKEANAKADANPNANLASLSPDAAARLKAELKSKGIDITSQTKLSTIKEEINKLAIPKDTKPTTPIKEATSIEDKRADIERRRIEELLSAIKGKGLNEADILNKNINAKYDAELAALDNTETSTIEEKAQAAQNLTTKPSPIKAAVKSATEGIRKFVTNPIKIVQNLFTRSFNANAAEATNKSKAIIENHPDELAKKISVSAKLSKEGKNDNFTPLPYFENNERKSTGLYRKGYKYELQMSVDGKPIGLLQPSDTLYFKDGDTYKHISELTPEQYEEVTKNSPDTYKDFMESTNAYNKAIKEIEDQFDNGKKDFSTDELSKLFSIGVTYSVPLSDTAADSTRLKDITYDKGNVVLSLPFDTETGKRTTTPDVIGSERLTDEDYDKLLNFVSNNIDKLHNWNSRYMFVTQLPDGTYSMKGTLPARASETSDEANKELIDLIKRKPVDPTQTKEINRELNDKFFIADSSNGKGKGANIKLVIKDNGDIAISLHNENQKYVNSKGETVPYRRLITLPDSAKKVTSLAELVNIINGKLKFQVDTLKDKPLERMGVHLAKEDFKSSILNDDQVSYDELKDKLAVSVKKSGPDSSKSDIFGNSNMYIIPKSMEGKESKITETNTPKSQPIKETPVETKTSTATSTSFLKDKEAKAAARTEAQNQTTKEVDDEFTKSLGCK